MIIIQLDIAKLLKKFLTCNKNRKKLDLSAKKLFSIDKKIFYNEKLRQKNGRRCALLC